MTIYDEIKHVLKGKLNSVVTSSEVVALLKEQFHRNPSSIILADYCYNRYNNGISFDKHIFEYIDRNKYKYLGENYLYDGTIFHRKKNSKEDVKIGLWINGVKTFYGKENEDFTCMIPEIRIIPMSAEEEFNNKEYSVIQEDFFMSEIINRESCKYYYRAGLNTHPNSLLLFQYKNQIIASANIISCDEENILPPYKGAYLLKKNSIKVFEPITKEELNEVDNDFKEFNQSKQYINIKYLKDILELINSKQYCSLPEDLIENKNLKEGVKKRITVNAYERNLKARQECIKYYGAQCQICGFDFGKIYGKELEGKIHVHHKKPLSEIDKEYIVDPIKDMVPVCPNCHLVLHSKSDEPYTIDEVINIIKETNQI